MSSEDAFQTHTDRYDEWFERYEEAYDSEVNALKDIRPPDNGPALEIGVGTGRFAVPLGVDYGVDPSVEMLGRAVDRGIPGILGVAENLPVRPNTFSSVVIVTTICFVDDVDRTLREAARILQPGGHILLGYIDKESDVGQKYQEIKDENPFYQDANFLSTEDLIASLEAAGFDSHEIRQTIFELPSEDMTVQQVEDGYGSGSFVALRSTLSE